MTEWHPDGSLAVLAGVTGAPAHEHHPAGDVAVTVGVAGEGQRVETLAGAGLEVRVYDRADPNHTLLAVVARPELASYEDVLNDVGSGQVIVVTNDLDPAVFANEHIWKILWEGVERFAFIAQMDKDITVADDEVHRRTVGGPGVAALLGQAIVYPLGIGSDSPIVNRQFAGVSRASIVATVLAESQARGTVPAFSRNAWNATVDSYGTHWADINTLEVVAGTTLLELIQNYGALGWDWHVDSQMRISLAPKLGVDRHMTVRVEPAGSVAQSEVTRDRRELGTAVVVQDGNGGVTEQTDSTAIAKWGRRERYANSTDAIDAASRANVGYSLLQLWKDERAERLVQVSPDIVGKRPFIDYGVGDTISVEFTDGTVLSSRVVGLALEGSNLTERVRCEATLDFMLEQNGRGGTTSTATAGTSDGIEIVYTDNGSTTLTIDTSPRIAATLTVEAFQATSARCKTYLRGTASTGLTVTADVMYDGNVIRTMRQVMAAGEWTWAPEFMITALPAATKIMWLRLSTSTGTVTIQPFDLQFWLEGKYLNGGAGSISPTITVDDTIPLGGYPAVTTTSTLTLQTPVAVAPSAADAVGVYPSAVTDTVSQDRIYTIAVAASGDDGTTSDGPSFSSSATQLEVGDDGGTIWGAFMRFVIPSPGIPAGATIDHAYLKGTGDQTDSGALTTIRAELAAAPTAATSRADFLARSRTTATVNWDSAVTSGTALTSPDLAAVIQELVTTYGASLAAIQLFHENRSSPTNGKMLLRSKDNSANQPPTLEIRWH